LDRPIVLDRSKAYEDISETTQQLAGHGKRPRHVEIKSGILDPLVKYYRDTLASR